MSQQVIEQAESVLLGGCEQLGLSLSSEQVKKILAYLENLLKWNKAYNLTAIRDPRDMVVKHLLDSLSIYRHIAGTHILDVGTGPGLPGIPVSICDTNKRWTLIDSNGKKTRFLLQMKSELALSNLNVVKGRIEQLMPAHPYDVITSRAFSSLSDFVGVCLPLLQQGGVLLAMKGVVPENEIEQLDQTQLDIQTLTLDVPYLDEERHLVMVKRKPNG